MGQTELLGKFASLDTYPQTVQHSLFAEVVELEVASCFNDWLFPKFEVALGVIMLVMAFRNVAIALVTYIS